MCKFIAKIDYLTLQNKSKDCKFVKEKIIWISRFIFLTSVILWLKSNVLTVEVFLLILSFLILLMPGRLRSFSIFLAFFSTPFHAFVVLDYFLEGRYLGPSFLIITVFMLVFLYFTAVKTELLRLIKVFYLSLGFHLILVLPCATFPLWLFSNFLFSETNLQTELSFFSFILFFSFPSFLLSWIFFFLSVRLKLSQNSGVRFLIFLSLFYVSSLLCFSSLLLLPGIHQ